MKNKKLPTAEEVYNDFHFNYKGDGNKFIEAMKHFANIHVQEVKNKIKKKLKTSTNPESELFLKHFISKDQIDAIHPKSLIT